MLKVVKMGDYYRMTNKATENLREMNIYVQFWVKVKRNKIYGVWLAVFIRNKNSSV